MGSQPVKVPGRFRAAPGSQQEVVAVFRRFQECSGEDGFPTGGFGRFRCVAGSSGSVPEVPGMLPGVSVQVPVQCVFLNLVR